MYCSEKCLDRLIFVGVVTARLNGFRYYSFAFYWVCSLVYLMITSDICKKSACKTSWVRVNFDMKLLSCTIAHHNCQWQGNYTFESCFIWCICV